VKWPMLAGSLATLAMCVAMARRLMEKTGETNRDPHFAADVASVAGIAWLLNPAVTVAIYHCRPDPLLVAFLTGAWILGTDLVDPAKPARFSTALMFWLCVGFAALTKGPAALLPVIYLPLAARLIFGSWKHAARAQWWWGAPLAAAMFSTWIVPVALSYPDLFEKVLVKQELFAPIVGLGARYGSPGVTNEGPIALITGILDNPHWFLLRFAPWSLAAIGALIIIRPRRWFHHAMAPAVLWLLLVIVFFTFSANKTDDYIMPAYPAAAILATFFCAEILRRLRLQTVYAAIFGLLLLPGFVLQIFFFSEAAKSHSGDELKNFARVVRDKIDNQPVVFIDTGYNTLQFFLHRHQPGNPDVEALARAPWVIMPLPPDSLRNTVVVTSANVSTDRDKTLLLGLFHRESDKPRTDY
jgi:4-amino-4-deoxy-L-arabinose transferase-like glycosyltransferase